MAAPPQRYVRKIQMAKTYDGPIDAPALNDYVERVSRLMTEQAGLAEDIAEICASADEAGIASKREIRRLARERLMEPEVLQSQLQRMDDLRHALADFTTTPLGEAAMERAEATATKPRPFAEQTVHPPRRGRPRKSVDDAFAEARAHLGGEPAGTA
jgi:uncharacterized protein (UPF0335 family)